MRPLTPSKQVESAILGGQTRRSRFVSATVAVFLMTGAASTLSGCWQGQNAGTYQQSTLGATGDGVEADTANKSMGIRGAIIIADDNQFSVVVTLVNRSTQDDGLVSVEIPGAAVDAINPPLLVMPNSTLTIGQVNSEVKIFGTGLTSEGNGFVPVRFTFANGGVITTRLLVRAPEGIWTGIPVAPGQ